MLDGLPKALRQLRELLGPQRWSTIMALAFLMLLSALTELIAIFSFVPFAALASKPSTLDDYPLLQARGAEFGLSSNVSWLLFLGGMVLTLFLASSILRACTLYACSRFAWKENERLSGLLLESYSRRTFLWFLKRHTSDLTREVVTEVGHLVEHVLMKLLMVFSRCVIAVFIAVGIFVANPTVALLSLLILGLTYGFIYKALRNRLTAIGKKRVDLLKSSQRVVSETFASIKEAKSTLDQSGFQEDNQQYLSQLKRLMVFRDVTAELPILLAETLAVVTILAVAIYFSATEDNPEKVVALSILYLTATIRITPLLQGIYANLVRVRFFLPVLDQVHGELTREDELIVEPVDISFEETMTLKQVGLTYPGSPDPALSGIDLVVTKNSCIGLVGPTGGGKTTLADVLAGLLPPSTGEVLIDNQVAGPGEMMGWRRRVGYVPQEIFLCDEPVWKNIALGVRQEEVDRQRVEAAAKVAKIHDFISTELDEGYDTILGERGIFLSGGQRQRIGIARALYREPDILILDEATSALDNATERAFMETVDQLANRKTLILIAHRLSTVKNCDVIYVVRDGALDASGTYEQLCQDSETFRELL